jgi:putative ABC transport system permease protein
MGIPIVRGRPFTERDAAPTAAVVIINRLLADQLWPGADPIGRRVARARNPRSDQWLTMVGVVANVVRTEISRGTRIDRDSSTARTRHPGHTAH